MTIIEKVRINAEILREITEPECCFTNNFKGFEEVVAVRTLFGEKTKDILQKLKVEFTPDTIYMKVTNEGRLLINPEYFKTGNLTDLYLDIIHELVHVKQTMEGKSSNPNVNYVDRPLEIEAYGITVNEAKNLNLSEERILDYLESELIKGEDLQKLYSTLETNSNFNSLTFCNPQDAEKLLTLQEQF